MPPKWRARWITNNLAFIFTTQTPARSADVSNVPSHRLCRFKPRCRCQPSEGMHRRAPRIFAFRDCFRSKSPRPRCQVASMRGGRSWTTQVSCAIENLNILNVVTADRVVAQISTDHPLEGYTPRVSFVGTQFVNLRIGGYKVDPSFKLDFCGQGYEGQYPDQPCIQDSAFLKGVADQYLAMRPKQKGVAGRTEEPDSGLAAGTLSGATDLTSRRKGAWFYARWFERFKETVPGSHLAMS